LSANACQWPLLAHLGDGGRPSWRPLIGVVLPPLWHQGHKGYAPVCRGVIIPGPVAARAPVGRAGVVGASEMATGVVVGSAVILVAVLVLTAPAISWWAAPSGAAERCLLDGEVTAAHRQHHIEPRPQRIVRGGDHLHFVDRCRKYTARGCPNTFGVATSDTRRPAP
jgi:hypothetical protein